MTIMKDFSIYGNLVDRYLFNFRVDPDILEKHMPKIKWLKLRKINGYGIVSFCILKLKGLNTISPIDIIRLEHNILYIQICCNR